MTGKGYRVLAAADSGLLLRKPTLADRMSFAKAILTFGSPAKPLIRRTVDREPGDLLGDPKVEHVPWAEIESIHAETKRLRGGVLAITATDGRTWKLKWETASEFAGQFWPSLAHFLGERFSNAVPAAKSSTRNTPEHADRSVRDRVNTRVEPHSS